MSHDPRLDAIDHQGRIVACADCPVCGLAYVVESRPVDDGEDEGIAFVITSDAPCPQCVSLAARTPLLHALMVQTAGARGQEDAPSGVVVGGTLEGWVYEA